MKKSKLYSVLISIFRPIFKIIYRYEIIGKENVPMNERCIICANHTSLADPVLLAMGVKRQISYMAKVELFKNKLFGKILLSLKAFPVTRGKQDNTAINYAVDILKNGEIMGIFIEGTRSQTGEFLKPKPGAALIAYNTESPVVPAYIRSKDGGKVKPFRKTFVVFGKPLSPKDLGLESCSGKELRTASRMIMQNIKDLAPNQSEVK